MSKLLINESPLTFQPTLAVKVGVNEAIVLQQVHYWISNPKNKGYEQDGYKWVWNTYAEWRENNFPFWSENTIQRTFSNLEDAGLIVSIQPMKGKYDRTKYYRIDYDKLSMLDDPNLVSSDDPNLVRSLNESETTTETTGGEPPLNEIEIQQANAKVDAIIANSSRADWRGRETFAPQDWALVDWYHKATGQDCPKAKYKDWHHAVALWKSNGLTVADLQAAYDMDIKWRVVFTSPNQLTDKAIALRAQGRVKTDDQRGDYRPQIGV